MSFPRNASVPSIRAAIVSARASEPSVVKAVWLVGHIPPAFSGTLAPDGHSARAFPADGYYGDVNGTWTPSTSINVTTLQGTRTMAPPNDARFSPDTIPSPLELAVGRIDMLNLPLIAAGTETQLLTACFTKLHPWKTASTTATRRASLPNGLEGHHRAGARCRAPRRSNHIGVLSVAQLGGRAPPTPALRHAQTMCSWRSR